MLKAKTKHVYNFFFFPASPTDRFLEAFFEGHSRYGTKNSDFIHTDILVLVFGCCEN